MKEDKRISAFYRSPIGTIRIIGDGQEIAAVEFVSRSRRNRTPLPDGLKECARQLDEYFGGTRKAFSLPLRMEGTPFQRSVWRELLRIPFGETRSYRDIAMAIGRPKAIRAVGGANHRNPISIIVPCHRVIGSDGSLVGYGGGLRRKLWLLRHEAE